MVYIDGFVRATDKDSKNLVEFAAIRPIRIYEGGWTHGYVKRQYLASLCPLEGSMPTRCVKKYDIIHLYTLGHCKQFRAIRNATCFWG